MPKPGSVAKTKARLFPNQSALVDNIVANKNVNKYEGNQYFKWNIAQLHLDESANNKTGGMETNSITVYLKRAPRPGVDVMSLYRERQERAASKQGQQQMVTGQDTDQGKLDLVEFYYENTRINSMYNAVPQNYDNQERDGSMSPVLSYNLNRQDQLNIPTTSYWTVQDQNEFPMLIERYGTDWHGIAKSTGTKTHTMIKNYYQRQVDLGHKELEEKARIADERRNRGESATPLPPQSMSQAQLQFQMTTQQQQSQNPQQTQPQKTQQQQPGINNRELREITPHEQANNAGPGAGLHQGTTRDDETLVDDPTEASATKSAANARPLRRRTKRGCLACRRRRIKCGEERPTCSNCIMSKRQCEGYNQPVIFKFGIPDRLMNAASDEEKNNILINIEKTILLEYQKIDPVHLYYRDEVAKDIRQEKQWQMPRNADLGFIGGLDTQHQDENISSTDGVVVEGPFTDSGDIFNKLENHFDSTNWNTLEKALPLLIKAFAIKIGYNSSAQVNQDIMYFIHKQYNVIISHLKTMFCREDDGQPTSGQRGPKGMSLLDKMSMWDNKAGEIDTVAENDELFEGVGDDDDEITNEVGLSKYHEVILKSPSYEWLLSSLRKESSLQWGSRQPRIMVENIRQKILDKLPTSTISKRRPLNVCEVIFELRWDDTTDMEDRLRAKLMTSDILLSELIAVTGCREESQALTVEQYLRQTWPAYGLQLLSVLQRVIINYDQHCSVVLPDNSQLNARIRGSHFTVTAIGPAQFIAECAEQIAWLQAALLCNRLNLAGYCVPSIENYRVDTTHSSSKQLKYRGRCDIAVGLTPLANPTDVIPQKPSWQQDLVGKSTVIQGFPISRRPEAYSGLELSFKLLLSSVQTNGAIIDDGLVLLKGPISSLQFSIDLRRLKTGRHILAVCNDLLATMGENSERMREKISLPEAKCVQHYTSRDRRPLGNSQNTTYNLNAVNPNEILSAPPERQDKEKDSMSSVSSQVDYSIPKSGFPLYTESPKGHLVSNDQTSLPADSPSNSTMPSQDESLDSDMFSISDASEQFEFPESNAAHNPMPVFSSCERGRGQSTTQAEATGPSTTSGDFGQSRKKRCAADDDDDADQDDFRKRPNKKPRHDPTKGPQISFACPYLKIDPVRHETDFRSDEALDEHLDLNTCPRNRSRSLEGISNKQQKELSRKSKTGIGEEEQWFKIWEILFYTRPRPSSVYMDTELSVQLRLFKEYCDTRESDVVVGLYEADPIWSGESTEEQRRAFVQMVFAQGMNRVFEDYRLSLRSREQGGDGAEPTQSEAPLSSFADSGIAVGSQASPQDVNYRRHIPSQPPPGFGNGELSTQRHIPSQSSPRDVSSRGHTPSQAPPIFDNGGPSVWMSQDENFRRHIPSQPPTTFNSGEPSASIPNDESSRRQIPSQPPAVSDNGEPRAWTEQDENPRSQISSQPPVVFYNGGPDAWMEQDGMMQMQQGLENGPLDLNNDYFNFGDPKLALDYFN
ncbi:hypothetical protein V496_07824 [Pseudogymnoascus sp. VKM F-4515 (FW-2607)]|nr:hypothetical protein V496_07824 [Pseudogymnoascus sp. VKM F-4515 (FW-2607)]